MALPHFAQEALNRLSGRFHTLRQKTPIQPGSIYRYTLDGHGGGEIFTGPLKNDLDAVAETFKRDGEYWFPPDRLRANHQRAMQLAHGVVVLVSYYDKPSDRTHNFVLVVDASV